MITGARLTLGSALGISLTAHALVGVTVLGGGMLSESIDERPQQIEIEIAEPEIAALPPDPRPREVPHEPDEARPELPAPQLPTPPRPDRPSPTIFDPSPAPAPAPSVVEVPHVEMEPRPPVDDERERERIAALIDPRAAARSSFAIDMPGPSRPRAGTSGHVAAGTSAFEAAHGVVAQAEREAEATHSGYLREQAMAKRHLSRTEPTLRRRPDGSHVYEGHAFRAVVRADGSVAFDDRPSVQTEGFSTSGSFDLTDLFMRAGGGDPYAAEREWFMEHTEELRVQLETEARTAEMDRGLRLLRGRLARIWQDESRTPEARRRAVFDEWDRTDELDRRGRDIVVAFIRSEIPAGSELAYTAAELRSMNAMRESTEPFAPY